MSSNDEPPKSQPKDEAESSPEIQKEPEKRRETKRDSVTDTFLHTLGTSRGIRQPIRVQDQAQKPQYRTADKYEIPYNPESDKNHPYEMFRRNRYLRCLCSREIARHLDRKTFITVSVREALIYSVFLTLLSVITFGSFSLEKFFLSEAMINRYTQVRFDIESYNDPDDPNQDEQGYHLMLSFHQINTIEHVWFYQYHLVNNVMFKPFWNTENKLFENKMMGLAQIRQLRVRNGTCKIPEGIFNPKNTPPCYGPYTKLNEETTVIGKPAHTLTERLAEVNIWRPPNETGLMPFSGNMATYGGGGYVAPLYNEDDANQLSNALKSLKWYTRGTRAIFIEFTIYNGNVNLFGIFKLIFEIPPSGGVIPMARIYVKKLIRYNDSYDMFILTCEIISMVFVVFYTCQKLIEIITLRRKFFSSFWIYIDIMVLIMSYLTFTFNLLLYFDITKMVPELMKTESEAKFISFDYPLHLHLLYSRSFAVLIGFAFLRLLKYFNIVHSMYELQTTMARAIPDILSYLVIFFYFYFVFALVGVFLFGCQLEDFRTFPMALYTLMKYSIADFHYDKLTHADPLLGPIFFFAYIFTIVFILGNIFLAILVSKYQEVRSEVSIGGAKTFIKDMLMYWFLQLLRRMECPWLLSQIEREEFEEKVKSPTEHVRFYLRQAGYSELEIELFFKKYDITDSKIEAMDESRISYKKGEREAPPPLSQKDIMRYIIIQKLDYLESHYRDASILIDAFLKKLSNLERRKTTIS